MLCAFLPSHGKETSILVFPSEIVCDGRISTYVLPHFRVSCFVLLYACLSIRKHATTHIHAFLSLVSPFFPSHFSFSAQHDFAFISLLIDLPAPFLADSLFFSQSFTHSHARTRSSVVPINKIVCNNA